jgi:hypothetical protein
MVYPSLLLHAYRSMCKRTPLNGLLAKESNLVSNRFLWHYKQIKDGIMGRAKLDVHARLMRKYPKTPWYWFAGIIAIMFAVCSIL